MIQKEQQSLLIYVILGLLVGIGLDGLFYQKVKYIYPYLWLSSFALILGLAFDFRHRLRIVFTSAIVSTVTCSPFLLMGPDAPNTNSTNLILAVGCFPYAWMIAHSFHFAYHLDNQIRMRYTTLFYAVWNTIPLLIIAGVFAGIAKLLILLTGGIFAAFKFKTIADFLFSNNHFSIISTAWLYITGIGIARQNLTILDSFRFVILKLFYYLYPFLVLISLIYLILYTYTAAIGHTPEASAVIFMILSILGIIFFNAIFQDGEGKSHQSKALGLFLRSHRLMLLLITILTVHLFYPDSKTIINALLLLTILILYGLLYGISAIVSQQHSKQLIKSANVVIALLYIFGYLIINNPLHPIMKTTGKTTWGRYDSRARQLSDFKQSLPKIDHILQQQDNKLEHLGLTWQASTDNQQTVYNICRSLVKPYGWIAGKVVNHHCLVARPYESFMEKNYQVLTGNPSILTWGPEKTSMPLSLGSELYYGNIVKSQTVCRIKLNKQYKIGSLRPYSCHIPRRDLPSKQYRQFEVLTINVDKYPQKMSLFLDDKLETQGLKFVNKPTDNMFIAGVNAKGNIGICRGAYKNGLQIGSYQNKQCRISYIGTTLTLSQYSVLTYLKQTPSVRWKPKHYRAVLGSEDSLSLGYEKIKDGSIRHLEACRGIYKNVIYIGKVINSRCNITVGEREVELQKGYYTSLQLNKDND